MITLQSLYTYTSIHLGHRMRRWRPLDQKLRHMLLLTPWLQYCKSDIYTVNCGMGYGQAAMLLSQGAKGFRAVQPNSSSKLYLPKVNRSSGAVIDMWIKAKELDANTESYIELLAKGTRKTKEEITKDVQQPKYFQAQEAIDYGLADKIIDSRDAAFEKRNYDEMLAQSKARSRGAGSGPQAAPSGFR